MSKIFALIAACSLALSSTFFAPPASAAQSCYQVASFAPYGVQTLSPANCSITPTGYGWSLVENAPYPLHVAVSRSAGLDNCGILVYEGELGDQPVLHHIPSPGTQCQLESFPLGNTPPGAAAPARSPRLWLRADAGVTLNDGKVSFWADQSGYGTHAYMPTAARQPALVYDARNTLPVLRFDGAQSLVLKRPVSPRSFTVFVVGKNSNPTESYSMILGPGGSWANNQLRWESGSKALFVGTSNNLPVITSPIGNTRVYHALSARFNGSRMEVFRDGKLISTHNFTTTGPWTLSQIGAWYGRYFMIGDLAEVLMYSSSLSDADYALTSAYLRARYALP